MKGRKCFFELLHNNLQPFSPEMSIYLINKTYSQWIINFRHVVLCERNHDAWKPGLHDYKKGYSLYGILRKKFGVSGELILGFAGEINWGI